MDKSIVETLREAVEALEALEAHNKFEISQNDQEILESMDNSGVLAETLKHMQDIIDQQKDIILIQKKYINTLDN